MLNFFIFKMMSLNLKLYTKGKAGLREKEDDDDDISMFIHISSHA